MTLVKVPYQIVCYECNKLLQDAAGNEPNGDIYGNREGEDVCEACHDRNTEPYIIWNDDGDVIGFHARDCGSVEVEYIYPQPIQLNETLWFHNEGVYQTDDLQNELLGEMGMERDGGPVLIDGFWYWSPVFVDEEYEQGGLWQL